MNILFFFLNVLSLATILFLIWRNDKTCLRPWFFPSLLLHLLSGICVGLLYQYYYQVGDTLLYFQEGMLLSKFARENFSAYVSFLWDGQTTVNLLPVLHLQDSRALLMAKIVSISNLLSGDNYWISSLYFSLISFFAAWKLAGLLSTLYPKSKMSVIVSFLAYPSIVFWSSGIVKESLGLAALYYVAYIFLMVYKKIPVKIYHILLLLLSVWILFSLKYYFLAVFSPVVITTYVHQRIFKPFLGEKFLPALISWLLVFMSFSLLIFFSHPNFLPERFLSVLYNNYLDFQSFSNAEDVMTFPSLGESWASVIMNAPWALFSGLFRPFLWEAGNLFQVIASLENLILLFLTITALPSLQKMKHHTDRMLIFAALVYCATLCVFLTLSTPNFGTLIRYRVGFLPFFVFLITANSPIIHRFVNNLSSYYKKVAAKKG